MVIAIVGDTGSGKTGGAKYLNPKETYYNNADGYPLTFKGGFKNYSKELNNYDTISDMKKISELIQHINLKVPSKKNVIIDTVNACMNDIEMLSKTKGHDKWKDLAEDAYALIKPLQTTLRDDLMVFMLFHSAESETGFKSILTNGRKLEKIKMSGLFSCCLFTEVITNETGEREYKLRTQYDDNICAAKSFEGCFEPLIDNNFQFIRDSILQWRLNEK